MKVLLGNRVCRVEVERMPSVVDWYPGSAYWLDTEVDLTDAELDELGMSDAFGEACMEEAMEGGYTLD